MKHQLIKKWVEYDNYTGQDFTDHYIAGMRLLNSPVVNRSNFEYTRKVLMAAAPNGESHLVIAPYFSDDCNRWRRYILVHQTCKTVLKLADDLLVRIEALGSLNPSAEKRLREGIINKSWRQWDRDLRVDVLKDLQLPVSWADCKKFPYDKPGSSKLMEAVVL